MTYRIRSHWALSVLLCIVLSTAAIPSLPSYAFASEGEATAYEVSTHSETPAQRVHVTCQVIGPNDTVDDSPSGSSVRTDWASCATYALDGGSTAADLTEAMFAKTGLVHASGVGQYGYFLSSIAAPGSQTGIGFDQATGNYWQLFVNGSVSQVGASDVHLKDGDRVVWAYSSYGESLDGIVSGSRQASDPGSGQGETTDGNASISTSPDGGVDVNPDAPRPTNMSQTWSGYATGNSSGAEQTPTQNAQTGWTRSMKDPADWRTQMSSPIVVGDALYIAVGNTLEKIDAQTGDVRATATLAANIDSIARMRCDGGLVVVPLSGGRMQALTLDDLRTVWVTSALPAGVDGVQQSLSTPLVHDGILYAGCTSAGWTGSSDGYFYAVSLLTGNTDWIFRDTRAGYYWTGAAYVNGWIVVPDDKGTVQTFPTVTSQGALGVPKSLFQISAGACRSTAVASSDGMSLFITTTDGVIHKLTVSNDGRISEIAHANFATSSTGTVSIENGYVFVGGATGDHHGVLAVFDEALNPIRTVTDVVDTEGESPIPADVKSVPLVVTQSDGTFVYFTSNDAKGSVYVYKLGDAQAHVLYTPDESQRQYCMASVVAGADGALYYINDSGTLFKIVQGTNADHNEHHQTVDNDISSDSSNTVEYVPSETPESADSLRATLSNPAQAGTMVQPLLNEDGQARADDRAQGQGTQEQGVQDQDKNTHEATGAAATASEEITSEPGDDTSETDASQHAPDWAPLLGLVVGVAGLGAAAVLYLHGRKGC